MSFPSVKTFLAAIGYHGPNTLLALILAMLAFQQQYTNPPVYLFVIGWQFVSHLLNVIIKNILQLPRPDSKEEDFAALKPTLANYMTIHQNYGMPSGHAQAVCSELIFIAFYFQLPVLTVIAAVKTALTLWQRYAYHRHSAAQLAVGSLLGTGVGFAFYKFFKSRFPML